MLEFILDIVFDLIIEGSTMLLAEKKVPMVIRVIAFIVVVGLYLGGAGLLIFVGYSAFIDKDYIASLILLAIVFFILIAGFIQTRKELRKRKGEI